MKLPYCVEHGVHDISPEDCPLCPICDQPLWASERINLQTVDAGPGNPDLVRLVHTECSPWYEEDEDE